MTLTEPVPPQAIEAEESVIGAMMLSPNAIEGVSLILSAEDFYRPGHGLIFTAAVTMHERGEPVDLITLTNELEELGMLERIGGRMRLLELANLVPATANAPHYARIVADHAALRALVNAGQNIARLGYDRPGDTESLIAQAEEALSNVRRHSAATAATPFNDGFLDLCNALKIARETGERTMGALMGIPPLDEMLGGLWGGQLILLAARPSVGKSAFALNVAENFADRGDTTLFASLEMSKRELQTRSLARAARVDGKRISRAEPLSDDEFERIRKAWPKVNARTNLHMQDDGGFTLSQLKAETARLITTQHLKLVVVDYLQLMATGDPKYRVHEVAAISRQLKQLARKHDIPVIALSQLNRALESRNEKRPMLSDLRDSGALEQDADVVMFLHRESNYDTDVPIEKKNDTEVIVAKNRKGECGTEKLAFIARYSEFAVMGGRP